MKREVLTETKLRALGRKTKEVVLNPGALVTPAARDYARQMGINIRFQSTKMNLPSQSPPESGPVLAPSPDQGKFINFYSGARLESKPEHFTHLYGNILVQKNHPRIIFRGRLDLVQAHVIDTQVVAGTAGEKELVAELDEILKFLKEILKAEYKDERIAEIRLLGLGEEELRAASHDPRKFFNVKHVIPSHSQDELGARLNLLRTQVREAEITAVNAFCGTPDQEPKRPDILKAMNRLSSAVYILMCKYLGDPA